MYNYMDVGKVCLKKMLILRLKEFILFFNLIFLVFRGKRNCILYNKKKKNSIVVVRFRVDNRNRI